MAAASDHPLVTVVCSTFNSEATLRCTLRVLHQDFHNFEVRVMGECCTDGSEAVVAQLNDVRLHWFNFSENTGTQSEPNNEGMRRAAHEVDTSHLSGMMIYGCRGISPDSLATLRKRLQTWSTIWSPILRPTGSSAFTGRRTRVRITRLFSDQFVAASPCAVRSNWLLAQGG